MAIEPPHAPERSPNVERPLDLFIKRLRLRNSLSEEECAALRAIEPRLSQKKARWDIVRSGDHTDFACLVADGIIGRSDQFADGSRRTAAFYIAGDMCDLHSVAVPVAGWNISALTDCAYYEVAHDDLRAVYQRHPRLLEAFWRDTIVDASVLSKWVTVLSGLSVKQRIAHLFCEFGIRTAAAGLGSIHDFPFPLTQAQLAELVGATSVHVGRVLSELRDEASVRPGRGQVEIADLSTLLRVASYDATYLLLDDRIQQILL